MDVGQHDVETGLADADRSAGQHRALVVEPAHENVDAATDRAEHILCRHFAILEDELAGIRSAHSELVEFLRGRESPEALLDEKRGDAARARVRIRLGVDDERIGVGTVGDPHLVAIQNEHVAATLCTQLHRHYVRPRPRLAHRQRADVLAGNQLRQIPTPLLFGTVAEDLVDAEIRMRAVRETDRCRRARDLLHRDDVREIADCGAAVLVRNRDAEKSHVAHLPPQVRRKLVVAIDGGGARRDFLRGKLANRVAKHVDRFAMREIECRIAHGFPLSMVCAAVQHHQCLLHQRAEHALAFVDRVHLAGRHAQRAAGLDDAAFS